MELRRRETPRSDARCPLCHDDLSQAPRVRTCPTCATAYHPSCLRELGGCATLGCERAGVVPEPHDLLPLRGRTAAERTRRGLEHVLGGLVLIPAFGSLAIGVGVLVRIPAAVPLWATTLLAGAVLSVVSWRLFRR